MPATLIRLSAAVSKSAEGTRFSAVMLRFRVTAYGDLLLMDDSRGMNKSAYDPYKPYHNPCFFPLFPDLPAREPGARAKKARGHLNRLRANVKKTACAWPFSLEGFGFVGDISWG